MKNFVAVLVGVAVVNIPVFVLMIAVPFLLVFVIQDPGAFWVGFPAGFVAAWSWWSFMAPRWRLWAYERVASTGKLQEDAVAAGLLWRQGHFFERTEFRSAAQRRRQEELERLYP
jgi:hypothetical protein